MNAKWVWMGGWLVGSTVAVVGDFGAHFQSLKWQLRSNMADLAVGQHQIRCLNLGGSVSECMVGSNVIDVHVTPARPHDQSCIVFIRTLYDARLLGLVVVAIYESS
jgi:hypothetical protein